jgi:LysR family transcriptional regulator, glycine cleavage system transcriptional activator
MRDSLVGLPSLDLVKGFVAVARRMSVTQAADDLCITQSAMSKQVRALEDVLGISLLRRGHRSVSLTDEGERLFRVANASVQQLQDVVSALTSRGRRPVTITASIGVTALWLLPRLGDFQQRHPDIDVRVAANNAVLDLGVEQIDIAIRYCSAASAPHAAHKLFGESIAPVASPGLAVAPLRSPEQLRQHFLLDYDGGRRRWLQWDEWFAIRGWTMNMAKGMVRFNQYDQAIQAAVAGRGIALGRLELIAPMLADGRLEIVADGNEASRTDYSYWLVQADTDPRPEVRRVIDWVLASASGEA